MQQMYDMWLELSGYNRQADGSTVNQPSPEEKYITMPTDYAEPMVGFTFLFVSTKQKSENLKTPILFFQLVRKDESISSRLYFRVAFTAACVANTVTASGSGSSTFPPRSTRTECSAAREKMKL